MSGNKHVNHTIILIIFTINILLLAIPSQTGEFWESNDLGTTLLRGFGGTRSRNNIEHVVPRLTSDSRIKTTQKSSGIQFKQSAYVVPGWADTRFNFRKNITIDATKVTADLTNFPVLIDLYDSDLPNDAQASGNDIFFTNSSSHILDHEIELYDRVYNSTHAHLVAWVKMNLTSSLDTLISMYYGNPTIGNQERPANVWQSYSGIWHLSELGAGTRYDSTSNNNDGTPTDYDNDEAITGIIAGADDFDGTDDHVVISDPGIGSVFDFNTGENITISAWIRPESFPEQWNTFLTKGSTPSAFANFGCQVVDDDLDGVDGRLDFFYRDSTDTSWNEYQTNADVILTNNWYHVVFTYTFGTGSSLKIFVNGTEIVGSWVSRDGNDNPLVSNAELWLGADDNAPYGSPNELFDGIIDEVRISNLARSTEWINTEYANQQDPNSFYSIGTKESSPDYWAYDSYKYRKQITIDATKVSADLTNFPVLIDLYDTDLHDSAKVQADGDDLVFTTPSGVKLDHEIELFDQSHNTTYAHLVAWVRVPSLSATDDTDLMMYYGNKAALNQENPDGVWNNFEAIWLMNSDPSSTDLLDSTSNSHDLTVHGMSLDQRVEGKVGTAITLDGTDDYFDTNSFSGPINEFTISAWIKFDEEFNSSSGDAFLARGASANHDSPHLRFGPTDGKLRCEVDTTLGDNSPTSTKNLWTGDEWYYIGYTWSSSSEILAIYVDGSLERNDSDPLYGGTHLDWVSWSIGSSYGNVFWGSGELSHFTISKVARSVDWIATEYNNQNDPDSFFSVSSEEVNSNHWADGSFRNRKVISINSSKVSVDLTNFPVLIDLIDSDLKSGSVQSDADDIIFIDQTGVKIDHEIENFQQNSSLGRLIAWVRVPSLSSVSDTNITMYYGNSAVNSQENVNGVWDDYAGVWHLSETSGNVLDSTSYGEDGTIQGTDVTQGVTGIIDGAYNFGSWNGRVDFSDPADGHLDFGTGNFTMSFWLKSNTSNEYQRPIYKGAQTDGVAGYNFYRRFTSTDCVLAVSDTSLRYKAPTTSISNNVWTYVVGVVDRSTNEFIGYYNAVPTSPEDISALGSMDGSTILSFGRANNEINGSLDEVRLSNSYHSLGWIQTEYNNQYDPTSFISVTSEEIHPNWWADVSFGKRKDFVIAKEKVSSDLSNFPVLIDIYDSDLRTDVQADAADLMFTDSSNTKLTHEIELFDQAGNGTHAHLVTWVNVPTLFNNTDTLVTMYYGNSKILNQQNPEAVWDSSFKGVWHLNDDPSGTVYDSTSNNYDGTSGGSMTPSDLTSGKIGEGIDFDGINDYIGFPDPLSTQSMTISCWVYLNAASADWITIAMRSDGSNWFDWQLYARASDAEILAYRAVFRTEYPDTSEVGSDIILSTGNWYYINGEHNGTHNLFYVDGALVDVDTEPDSVGDSDSDVWIGGNEIWGEYLQGLIDEVRISPVTRSNAWIATEYNNQYDPTSFYKVGLEDELDKTPPVLNNFGVDDPGTGTGIFWADITDAHSGVDSALIKINGTEYSLSSNGTHWIKQLSVEFGKYYDYQIANASDIFDNYLVSPSSNKSYTFNLDNVTPDVLDWEYVSANNTFQANVTDSWGSIDTVIVNVTTHTLTASMAYYNTFSGTKLAYMNNTLSMPNGPMDFLIFVNDTSGNPFSSTTHSGTVYSNTAPVASNVTLSRDQIQELLPIFSNSTLYLDYNYSDADSQSEAGTEIRWFKDNGTGFTLQTNRNDSDSIPVSALVKGDLFKPIGMIVIPFQSQP
jgi:hypothetical protein